MDDRKLTLLIILIVAVVVVILYLLFSNNSKSSKSYDSVCTTDTDCSGSTPVCHDGKCVQCNFDTDCCGSDVCSCHQCQESEADPVTIANGFTDTQLLTNIGKSWMEMELTQFVEDDGGFDIDWSTFEIVSIIMDPTLESGANTVNTTWTNVGPTGIPPWITGEPNWQVTSAGVFRTPARFQEAPFDPDPKYNFFLFGICGGSGHMACQDYCDVCGDAEGEGTIHWRVQNMAGVWSNVAAFDFRTLLSI